LQKKKIQLPNFMQTYIEDFSRLRQIVQSFFANIRDMSLSEVGKTDDIKTVNYTFRNPISAYKEVGRVDWCMKCEKS
jgi:hypothetical protein